MVAQLTPGNKKGSFLASLPLLGLGLVGYRARGGSEAENASRSNMGFASHVKALMRPCEASKEPYKAYQAL